MEQQNSATMQSLNIEEEEEETNLESSNSTKKGGLLTMPFIIGTIHTHTPYSNSITILLNILRSGCGICSERIVRESGELRAIAQHDIVLNEGL